MKKIILMFLFSGLLCSAFAGEQSNGVCFPQGAEEIVRFYTGGECAGVKEDRREKKGMRQSKGIRIQKDRAGVRFEFNSAEIPQKFHKELGEWGRALQRLEPMNFIIAGHTDYIGSKSHNLDLSERRAEAVRDFLASKYRIEPQRLLIQAFGETRPLRGSSEKQSDEDRMWNRRVEFVRVKNL
ncbi:MAG: OmpA family protein [Gammaproteobacteria bacterium]|nr:OmpA family protein [Gammaproteobacteria bacterium]